MWPGIDSGMTIDNRAMVTFNYRFKGHDSF